MAILDRIRRIRHPEQPTNGAAVELAPIAAHVLPEVNQRVTVTMGEHVPVPSRVEDRGDGAIVLAAPALALEFNDQVVVTWEREGAWFSLDTRVLGVDGRAAVPVVQVAAGGRLSRHDERRTDMRREIELPIELRVIRSRAIRPGRELHTQTVEISASAVRFATSAPFAPGDLIEARIAVGEGARDIVTARVRVIRVDAVTGSWRSTCTAAFDEILRSDRARVIALADMAGALAAPGAAPLEPPVRARDGAEQPTVSSAPTDDGIGGRDEPVGLGSLDNVVEWLRRRG